MKCIGRIKKTEDGGEAEPGVEAAWRERKSRVTLSCWASSTIVGCKALTNGLASREANRHDQWKGDTDVGSAEVWASIREESILGMRPTAGLT